MTASGLLDRSMLPSPIKMKVLLLPKKCVYHNVEGQVIFCSAKQWKSFIKKRELLYLNFVNVLDVFGVVKDSHGHGIPGNIREHLWFTGLEKSWK